LYIDSDSDIQKLQARIDMQNEKVEFVESIIKNLPARGYQINAAISWEKFKVGA
jgi:tetrahydromethanopterin S-methyltransferase subunit G